VVGAVVVVVVVIRPVPFDKSKLLILFCFAFGDVVPLIAVEGVSGVASLISIDESPY